jgi:hypothetical protein
MASVAPAHVYITPAAPHCTETDLAMPFIEAIARQHRLQLSAGAGRRCRIAHGRITTRLAALRRLFIRSPTAASDGRAPSAARSRPVTSARRTVAAARRRRDPCGGVTRVSEIDRRKLHNRRPLELHSQSPIRRRRSTDGASADLPPNMGCTLLWSRCRCLHGDRRQ